MTDDTKRALLKAELQKPCSDPNQPTHLLGSEPFWCLRCNEFIEEVGDELIRLCIVRVKSETVEEEVLRDSNPGLDRVQ